MMKSFFKKLAFVMALAMVVSMAAPAATTASAASDLKIAYQNGGGYGITELNIAEVGATEDLKFLGAPSNWKELGATWSSNNEAVATVDQAGVVTAVAPGTADVAVQIGAEVAVVKVNVVNVATYTATMGTADDRNITAKTIEEGETFDFAFYGIKDYDVKRYFCTWASDDTSVATVDQKGLVTAVKAGTAKITLIVFNKVTGQVHNVDACTVTVPEAAPAEDVFTVAQISADTVALTFTKAPSKDDLLKNLKFVMKVNNDEIVINVVNVVVDGNVAKVTVAAILEDGETYEFSYADKKASFVGNIGEVDHVDFYYYTGKNSNRVAYEWTEEESYQTTFVPVFYNKDNIDITAAVNMGNYAVTFAVADDMANFSYAVDDNNIIFEKSGAAKVTMTVTWIDDNYEYREVEKTNVVSVISASDVVVTIEKAGMLNPTWYKVDDFGAKYADPADSFQLDYNSVFWKQDKYTTVYRMPSNDYREADPNFIFAATFVDSRGNKKVTADAGYKHGTFTYASSNTDVFDIDEAGQMYFYAPGKAYVYIYFVSADGATNNGKLVGTKLITVEAPSVPVKYEMAENNLKGPSHIVEELYKGTEDLSKDLSNNLTYVLKVYDQYGDLYKTLDPNYIQVVASNTSNKVTLTAGAYVDWPLYGYPIYVDSTDYANYLTNTSSTNKANFGYFSYNVTIDKVTDVTDTLKTKSTGFTVSVLNTKTEVNNLVKYLKGQDHSYKFMYNIGATTTWIDLAAKNIVNYGEAYQNRLNVWEGIKAQYLSTEGLSICNVPQDKLKTKGTLKTGDAGVIYFDVTVPAALSRDTLNSEALFLAEVANAGTNLGGKINLCFNDRSINDWYWDTDIATDDAIGAPELWNQKKVAVKNDKNEVVGYEMVDDLDGYGYTGAYRFSFYTVAKDNVKFGNNPTKTINITVVNNQVEVAYSGINADYGNESVDITDVQNVIGQHLMFKFDEWTLYADNYNGDGTWTVGGYTFKLDLANSVYVPSRDKVIFREIAIQTPLDCTDEKAASGFYTSIVKVNATIYQAD